MKFWVCLGLTLLAGCEHFGARPLLPELANIPEDMRKDIALCQTLQAGMVGDGYYTNGQAEVVTLLSYNGGCDRVQALEPRNGSVVFK